METPSFGTVLGDAYRKSRVALAYGLIFLALGLKYADLSDATDAALLALGILLLPVLFEIHRAVTAAAPPTIFRSFPEAHADITRAVTEYLASTRPASIRCLGLALFYQWPFLEDLLARLLREKRTQVSVELVMLDPFWKDMDHFNDAWSAQALGSYLRIQSFLTQHEVELRDLQWTITVHLYRFLPGCFGILLGDDTLFLGTIFCDHDRLKAGQNAVEMLKSSDVLRGAAKVQEFVGWFEYCKSRRLELAVTRASEVALPPALAPSLPS